MKEIHEFRSVTDSTKAGSVMTLLFLLLNIAPGASQDIRLSGEEKVQTSFAAAVSYYDREISRNSAIYTGLSYFDRFNGVKGHQYFFEGYWDQGSVEYDGRTYDSIYLMYDIFQDLVLIENFNSNGYLSPIKLFSPKVKRFNLNGFEFIRLEQDTISGVRDGFYNLMYEGEHVRVLVKWKKEIVNANDISSRVLEEFQTKNKYYFQKDNQIFQVKKKGSILKVLGDRKKDVKKFIKSNGYIFNDRRVEEMVEVAKFYETLM